MPIARTNDFGDPIATPRAINHAIEDVGPDPCLLAEESASWLRQADSGLAG